MYKSLPSPTPFPPLSPSQVRLMLVLAPAACILAGIAVSQAFLLFTRSIKAAVNSLIAAASGTAADASPAADSASEATEVHLLL